MQNAELNKNGRVIVKKVLKCLAGCQPVVLNVERRVLSLFMCR